MIKTRIVEYTFTNGGYTSSIQIDRRDGSCFYRTNGLVYSITRKVAAKMLRANRKTRAITKQVFG